MARLIGWALALVLALGGADEAWAEPSAGRGSDAACQKPPKKKPAKKKRKKKKAAPAEAPEPEAEEEEEGTAPAEAEGEGEPAAEPAPSPAASPSPSAEPAPSPSAAPAPVITLTGARKGSSVTPGSLSRWSNAGAMEPIVTEVEITAPLPARAVPLLPGQATPGQRLTAEDERLTAHLALYGDHSQTVRQDASDINLIRGRASIDYDRIASSDFGLHLDLEYRGSAGARRLTDRKINALYASYGATDFRRDDGPAFGVALGRVAVREAGYTQVDGAALRFRITPELKLGAYGGFTGNPHNYNWRLARTEDFSTGWVGGGLFGALRLGPVFADFAAGLSLAGGDLDRLFVYLDAGWAVTEAFDLFLTAWLDLLPDGTPFQNVELLGSYHPSRDLHLRVSAARYASLVYAVSTDYSYRFDSRGATIPPDLTVVDEAGVAIVPYDAVLIQSVYHDLGARLGYRVTDALEPYAALTVQIRGTGAEGAEDFEPLRILPAVGATFRDPEIIDVNAQVIGVVDAQTERKAILQLGVGRDFSGLRVGTDVRAYLGGVGSLDGGIDLTYSFPREWMPGRLLVRGMLRYIREDVTIARVPDVCAAGTVPEPAVCGLFGADTVLPLVPLQETVYGFLGVDWRF